MSATTTEMVSVLMTDLVGSTAMAHRVGPAAAEDLRQQHFELLRGALDRAGGREVKNLGDGLMVVFQSASQSLTCAVEMQQAVDARNRRAEEQLGVRIGVSIGDTTVEDGDYFGEPVVEAARLCAAAEGGQIVVNDLVHRMGGNRGEHRFQPLGGLELKGLSEPVEAFELHWEPVLSTGIPLPERLREMPATGYVGRVAERGRLMELWEEAGRGSLRLALISGEAGVGKTRLSTHLALEVRKQGATVLYGRCDEDLGVPYQPWAQALGYMVSEGPQRVLTHHVERHGGDLARLIPKLGDRVPGLPAPHKSDPETERYLLYAAAAGLLEVAGEQEPLLLILDDLQWADGPTLSLLRHVMTADSSMRVMVVGTYRDSDLSRDHPLTALLADLHREHGGERIRLTGLQSEDVLELLEALAGQELEEDGRQLAREITRETAGNPFFAGELLRHLIESGAIVHDEAGRWHLVGDIAELGLPQSVREVTGRRVDRLGADARTALSAAAVIGRDFDLALLLGVVDFPEARLLDLLDEAVAASLLEESSDRAGRFMFTHALVEHTLYEDLGRTRRARLHRQVAEALEEQCGDEPGERLPELARHWAAAVVSTDTGKAVHYARLTGERALAGLAPDEAVRWYRQALELCEEASAGDGVERCDLLIGLGEAQRQIGDPEFRDTLLEASELAQELSDPDRLGRAVLANSRGWTKFGALDGERVQALEAAAEALPDDDPRRAQVLALLAGELHFAVEPERCRALAAEAIAIARAAGDPAALAHTINSAIWTIWVPQTLEERRGLVDELVDLAAGLDDPRLSFWAAARNVMVGLETGDRSRVEPGLVVMRALAATVPQPAIAYMLLLLESGWASVRGDLAAAERLAIEGRRVGTDADEPGASRTFSAQMFHIHYTQGQAGKYADDAAEAAGNKDNHSGWRAAASLAVIEGGRADQARELARNEDVRNVPVDQSWGPAMHGWTDVHWRVGLIDGAGALYELLAPFPGQFATQAGVVYGSVDRALGELAALLERHEDSDRHFAAAVAADARFGAPLLLARTRTHWARALLVRGRPEDRARAESILDQAEEAAGRLGADGTMRMIAECRATLAAMSL